MTVLSDGRIKNEVQKFTMRSAGEGNKFATAKDKNLLQKNAQNNPKVHKLIIHPFEDTKKVYKGMSYGLSQCGYDLRLGSIDAAEYRTDRAEKVLKNKSQSLWLPPGGFVLGSTFDFIALPDYIMGEIKDKSSWARKGIALQNTVIEPGWFGYITLEITNHSNKAIQLEVGMPICQLIFHYLSDPCSNPYQGKYQNQSDEPTGAIHENLTD